MMIKKTNKIISERKKQSCRTVYKQKKIFMALSLLVPIMGESTNFKVTNANDDGTGLTSGTLSWAILQANENSGGDEITLTTDITITGVMTRLIDSDVTIQSDQTKRVINGNNQFRPLFIKSGNVAIKNIDIQSGLAKGGDPGGAGLGGAVFIYSGQVNISHVTISNSEAQGSENDSSFDFRAGGGGMFGDGHNSFVSGGGGFFASSINSQGGYGGWGNYQNADSFGRGGNTRLPGGFGGGGGGGGGYQTSISGGNGGFGGGGGNCYCAYSPSAAGDGGFGGGGGYAYYSSFDGNNGYGGMLSYGAGLGGAIFVRSGSLSLSKINMTNNSASASGGFSGVAKGLAGGIFVLHSLNNSNGNNQGMPAELASVTACEVSFINNQATSDPNTVDNNDDVFDLAGIINADTGDPVSVICSDVIFQNGFD